MHLKHKCESPNGLLRKYTPKGATKEEKIEDCKQKCDALDQCAGVSARKFDTKCELMKGPITQTSDKGFECLEKTNYVKPAIDYYNKFVKKKCTEGRINVYAKVTDPIKGVYVPTGATKEERAKDCLAECLKYTGCETVTAPKHWKKCMLLGFGTKREADNKYECYEKINRDEYSFTKNDDMQCLGVTSARTSMKMIKPTKGFVESDLRYCHVKCAADPACGAVSIKGKVCYLIAGRGLALKKRTKSGSTCYEKTLGEHGKPGICAEAKSKGLCDAVFESVEDCEAAFDSTDMATKFCPTMANMMKNAANKFRDLPEKAIIDSSVSRICGNLCEGTGFTMHADKKCPLSTYTKDSGVPNISVCLKKCAENDDCKAVYRRSLGCHYQSNVGLKASKYSGVEYQKKEYCFVKN